MLKSTLKMTGSFITGCIFTFFLHNSIFFYNTVHYTVPIQEKATINFEQPNIIFMYQKNRTDDTFYKMLSYSDNIIFIGDQNYKNLDVKLIDTLTQLSNQFPNAKTFAKLDDDALIHPQLYYKLVNQS